MRWIRDGERWVRVRGWSWTTVTLPHADIRRVLAAGLMMQVAGVFAIVQGFYLSDHFWKVLGVVSLAIGTAVVKVRYRCDHQYHRYSWRDGEFHWDGRRMREGDCPIWDSKAEPAWIAVQQRLRAAEADLEAAETDEEMAAAQAAHELAMKRNDWLVQGLQDRGLHWRPEDE